MIPPHRRIRLILHGRTHTLDKQSKCVIKTNFIFIFIFEPHHSWTNIFMGTHLSLGYFGWLWCGCRSLENCHRMYLNVWLWVCVCVFRNWFALFDNHMTFFSLSLSMFDVGNDIFDMRIFSIYVRRIGVTFNRQMCLVMRRLVRFGLIRLVAEIENTFMRW